MSNLRERDDITCPKDGGHIPLDRLSVCKFSEQLYFIHCPRCNVFHPLRNLRQPALRD